MGGIESYKKTVMRAVRLFNNACGEQIGEQIGGEKITVLLRKSIILEMRPDVRTEYTFRLKYRFLSSTTNLPI